MANAIYLNTQAYRDLAMDLRRAKTSVALELAAGLEISANELAAEARSIARNYTPTGQDPPTGAANAVASSVRVERLKGNDYRIRAGGPSVPLAGLWELGNKGSSPSASTFRHKVYGRPGSWVDQAKWRFMTMALVRYEPIFVHKMTERVMSALRRSRLSEG